MSCDGAIAGSVRIVTITGVVSGVAAVVAVTCLVREPVLELGDAGLHALA